MRKLFLSLAFFLAFIPIITNAQTNETPVSEIKQEIVTIDFFAREDCTHCQDQKEFLEKLKTERDDFQIIKHDIALPEERDLWIRLTEVENLTKATPITVIGNTIVYGFQDEATTGVKIKDLIDKSKYVDYLSMEEFIAAGGSGKVESALGAACPDSECVAEDELLKVPLLGVINVKNYSLPLLSFILGLIDGFNPCAMWVLITFIIVLAQIGSRKRMWQIAGLFILAETVMYYLILNVWFTVWDFVGLDQIITPIIGLVAIGGGIFFLYEWKTSDGTCKVTNTEQRSKTSSKIKKLASAKFTIPTIIGVIGLALSVNVIEFACSIGIPQAYTKIIELNYLSTFWEQTYILIYILAYMADDFIVFAIALYSIEKISITQKYSKWCNLAGGILMIILGLILIFNRGWLVF